MVGLRAYFLSEGISQPSMITICQTLGTEISNKIIEILDKYEISYTISGKDNRIRLHASPYSKWLLSFSLSKTSETKQLPTDYFKYNHEFFRWHYCWYD